MWSSSWFRDVKGHGRHGILSPDTRSIVADASSPRQLGERIGRSRDEEIIRLSRASSG
jgi:hypothetical protein